MTHKHQVRVLGAAGLIALLVAPASHAAPLPLASMIGGPPPNRRLVCRGPFSIEPGTSSVVLRGIKNRAAAGRFGENLAPSSCALEDRPLAGDEAALLNVYAIMGDDRWLGNTTPFVAECAATDRCLLWASSGYRKGMRGRVPNFWGIHNESDLRITWPDFRLMRKTKQKRRTSKKKPPTKKSTLPPGASRF